MPQLSETSISKVVTFDIEPGRYRRIFDIEAWNFDIDAVRYRRNVDIEAQNFYIVIYRYRRFLDIDKCSFRYLRLYTISKLLCFEIEFRVLRYRYFFVGSSLGCLLGTGHRWWCAHCIVNQSSPVAHAPPGPPSAAAAEGALGGAASSAAPGVCCHRSSERVILRDKN
jgi:hypothetical protein